MSNINLYWERASLIRDISFFSVSMSIAFILFLNDFSRIFNTFNYWRRFWLNYLYCFTYSSLGIIFFWHYANFYSVYLRLSKAALSCCDDMFFSSLFRKSSALSLSAYFLAVSIPAVSSKFCFMISAIIISLSAVMVFSSISSSVFLQRRWLFI